MSGTLIVLLLLVLVAGWALVKNGKDSVEPPKVDVPPPVEPPTPVKPEEDVKVQALVSKPAAKKAKTSKKKAS